MIFSKQQLMSDHQAITATVMSTNIIDLGVTRAPVGAKKAVNGDMGKAMVPLLVQVTEDFNNCTSVRVDVVVGATTTPTTVVFTQTILLADLKAGKTITIDQLPKGITGRYLGVKYTVVGTAPSAGQVMAGLTMGNHTNDIA